MKIGITHKLFLAILAAALLSVGSLVAIMHHKLDRGFHRFIKDQEQAGLTVLASRLEQRYAIEKSWDSLLNRKETWQMLLAAVGANTPLPFPPVMKSSPFPSDMKSPPAQNPEQRYFLLDAAKEPLIAPRDLNGAIDATPLRHAGVIVGYIGILPHKFIPDADQMRFLKDQQNTFVLVAGVILLLATGFSLLLSTRLIRPLRALALATKDLAAGNFTSRVPVTTSDELGQLARDFNALALSLEKTEHSRRGWVADISHELRTPLAVLLGEVEALQDGIRPLKREALDSLHSEIIRLGGLVDDLYQLSLSDVGALTYRKEKLDLAEMLLALGNLYRDDFVARNICLQLNLPKETNVHVFADASRLQQLFANLLDNSLKYTDPGGRVEIDAGCVNGTVTVVIDDSAPGVEESDLDRLFERLFRVEASRNRAGGGAGLGLAICHNIAIAHEGSISAAHSPLGGVRIRVVLPLWEG